MFVTVALADLHKELEAHYSEIGRPSIDPELRTPKVATPAASTFGEAARPATTASQLALSVPWTLTFTAS